jgi:hypothetical protein
MKSKSSREYGLSRGGRTWVRPSQLQEALREGTKVDAEHNLPVWVPKTRVNMTKPFIPGVDLRVHHVCLGPAMHIAGR